MPEALNDLWFIMREIQAVLRAGLEIAVRKVELTLKQNSDYKAELPCKTHGIAPLARVVVRFRTEAHDLEV